ncbi:hypothetical protein [Streptomyces canus]|uniref:hypothetical protein n=1 Tax=Streptomyces canus TaxID=58343 RepID=UPI0036E6EB5D
MPGFTTAAPTLTCHTPNRADLLLNVLPWIGIVMLIGLFTGILVGWISRKAGDNTWEAARHGLTAAIAPVGPLLTVTTLAITLLNTCPS